MSSLGPEVPEADALEQAQPAEPEPEVPDRAPKPGPAFEVPEADALEQSREIPADDDWR